MHIFLNLKKTPSSQILKSFSTISGLLGFLLFFDDCTSLMFKSLTALRLVSPVALMRQMTTAKSENKKRTRISTTPVCCSNPENNKNRPIGRLRYSLKQGSGVHICPVVIAPKVMNETISLYIDQIIKKEQSMN